jgi:hypothetical protein
MYTMQNICFCRQFAWLKCFTYKLVPILALKYKQHVLSPVKVRYLSLSQNAKKNGVSLFPQLKFFSYYYADEINYCPLGFILFKDKAVPLHAKKALGGEEV